MLLIFICSYIYTTRAWTARIAYLFSRVLVNLIIQISTNSPRPFRREPSQLTLVPFEVCRFRRIENKSIRSKVIQATACIVGGKGTISF